MFVGRCLMVGFTVADGDGTGGSNHGPLMACAAPGFVRYAALAASAANDAPFA